MTTKTSASGDQALGSVADEIARTRNRDWFHELGLAAARFFESNAKPVAAVVVLSLIAWSGWLGWGYVQTRQEKAAFEEYFAIEKQLNERREKEKGRESILERLKDEKDVKAKEALQKQLGSVVVPSKDESLKLAEAASSFSQTHSGRVAGALAALESAKLFQETGDAAKAVEVLKASAQSLNSTEFWGAITRIALAGQLVNLASVQTASACDEIETWLSPITAEKRLGFLWSEAHLKTGMCHILNGRSNQAKASLLLSQKGAQDAEPKKDSASGDVSNKELEGLKGIEPGSASEAATSLLRAMDAGLPLGTGNG